MNPSGPVLRDIHPPPPPSWWPPAYGWWLLSGLVLVVLVLLVVLAWRVYRRRRRWKRWERVFEQLRENHRRNGDDAWLAAELSQLLRRAARLHDAGAVMLRGAQWRAFLAEHAPKDMDVADLATLEDALYRRAPRLDAEAVLDSTRTWMRHAMGAA